MENKLCGVYCIKNLITDECYVGSSRNIKQRWRSHKDKREWYKTPNMLLYKAFQTYGLENFEFIIISLTDEKHLREMEQKVIEAIHPAYNVRRATKSPKEHKKRANRFKTEKGNRKAYQKAYQDQACLYNGEQIRFGTLVMRFKKLGIEKPSYEARKYII